MAAAGPRAGASGFESSLDAVRGTPKKEKNKNNVIALCNDKVDSRYSN